MINLFFVVHNYSGAKTYANELLSFLACQEEITVYKIYLNSEKYKKYTETKEGGILDIHIPEVKHKGNILEKYAARCIDLLSPLLYNKADVIFHLNNSTQVKLGLEARKRFNAKLVYTLHFLPNYFSWLAIDHISPNELTTSGDVLNKEIVQEADHIICVTRFARKMLNQYFDIPIEKTSLVYNGYSKEINNDMPSVNREDLKEKYGFQTNDRIILFVGRLEKGKGVEGLLEAFMQLSAKVSSLKLVLVGGGEYVSFMDLCKNCFGKVFFTGKLPKEKVEELYKMADIGVIPSEFEQCSYVALEMMKYGLPIIASRAPGLLELFEDEQNALLFSLQKRKDGLLGLEVDIQAIYRALDKLQEDKDLQNSLGVNAHLKWKEHLTSLHMGRATFKQYKEMVECTETMESN